MKRQDDEVARVGTEVGDSQFKYALWCHRFLFQENVPGNPCVRYVCEEKRGVTRSETLHQA
jgi:hypothetical protein